MKNLLSSLFLTLFFNCAFAQFQESYQAFDPTLNITMDVRKGQDLGVILSAGATGRRLPLSVFVGANLQEFDAVSHTNKDSSKYLSTTGLNVTMMLRLINIDWRDLDVNIYGTVFKNSDYLYESGLKIGLMLNGRNRMYLHIAETKNSYYQSFKVGASFSLFFYNGYDAY